LIEKVSKYLSQPSEESERVDVNQIQVVRSLLFRGRINCLLGKIGKQIWGILHHDLLLQDAQARQVNISYALPYFTKSKYYFNVYSTL
jgi:hypothetical protein